MCSNSRRATLSRSGARRRALADTGGPVVRMWCVTLCCTGRSEMHGCVTEGKSRRSAANSLAGSQDCKEGQLYLGCAVALARPVVGGFLCPPAG